MTANDRDLAGEALVLETMTQRHSLECAWKAVFPSPSEMAEYPTCIDDTSSATVRAQYSALELATTQPIESVLQPT